MNKRRFILIIATAHLALTGAVNGFYYKWTDDCFEAGKAKTVPQHIVKVIGTSLLMPIAAPTIAIVDAARSRVVITQDPLATPLALLSLLSVLLNSTIVGYGVWKGKEYLTTRRTHAAV
jgi:hypothetical protein